MGKRSSLILLLLLSPLFMTAAGSGAVINVPADYATIQAAVDAATNGDTVVIAIGTYTGDGNRDIDPNGKAVTIRSTDPNDPDIVAATVIDCNGNWSDEHRGFYFHSGEDANTILNGLTITNGYAAEGGGIYCLDSSPVVTNCSFIYNLAGWGGAIHNARGCNSAITNCTFSSNSANGGGAIWSYVGNNPAITNCLFTRNSAGWDYGGAIFNGGNSAITNCTFSDNWAKEYGGAIYNSSSNSAITNCEFTGNRAYRSGGAMYNYESNPVISNCTFSSNWAVEYGGAIYGGSSDSVIKNCILWGNTPDQIFSGSPVTYSNVQGGWEGVGNIDEEPHFASGTDLHLMPASSCIEAGDPNYIPEPNETDLDGNPRVAGARIDMGAYEYPAAPCIFISSRRIPFAKYRPDGLEKTLQIRNCGPGELEWEITEDCPWLAVSPIKGTSSGQVNEVTLTADAGGLSAGEYRCRITITGGSAINSPVTIYVILHIGSLLYVPAEYSTIQDAIDAAGNWDTVLVADGVYTGVGNRDIDFKGKKIQLKSENGAEDCIIDCNGSYEEPHQGFYFHSGEDADSILDGLTITNGYVSVGYGDGGGGIYCEYSSPAITNCTFSGNSAEWDGGAIYNIDSNPAITSCTFSGNSTSGWGGAMFNYLSNPAITSCTFSGNRASRTGGAIYNSRSNPAITDCTFSGNSVELGGGAISNHKNNPVITNCTFTGNVAEGDGGAIRNSRNNPTITNCTFTGNSAEEWGGAMINHYDSSPTITNCAFSGNSAEWGGAIYNYYDSNSTVTNCTLTGNSAERDGGAICNDDDSSSTVTNCILWGNVPDQLSPRSLVTYSDVQGGWAGVGNIDEEPHFAFDADLHLMPASPCIDVGDPNYAAGPDETDLDGNPRITGARIDMGAYEFPPAPCIAVPGRKITFVKDRPDGLEKTLQIRNCGPGELKWELIEDCPWLEVSPTKGTSSSETNEATLTADAGGLSIGEYRCRITIADGNAVNSPVTIDIILHIGSLLHVPGEYSTIQDAVDAANDWDTVLVEDGIYTGTGNRDIDFKGKKICLKSENGEEDCIIDCNGSSAEPHRAFYFHSGEDADSVVNGLTITNGYAKDGGGICCFGGSPAITNCTFSNNSAEYGGAMCNGIGCYSSYSSPTVSNCTFTGNSANSGGAMWNNRRNNPVVTNCMFSDNSARRDGGAMYNYENSKPVVTNCIFSGNEADGGGAMYNRFSSPKVTNCTFVNNFGGAMLNIMNSPAITNCTFSGNWASEYGGAMSNLSGNPVITNCILWGDKPLEIFNYGDSNSVITYSDVQGGWAGVGNIDAEPLFVDPCNGDYHLFEDSPCIDAGDPNYVAGPNETDLDGNPRIINDRIDMGAYELQPLTPAELLLDLTDYLDELGLHKGIAGGLRAKLNAALRLLEDGNENNDVAAVNLLEAFINAARAQYDKKIPAADADALIEAAQEIIWLLGGE